MSAVCPGRGKSLVLELSLIHICYDRELKESAAFDSVPGMEMTDGHPYPVYRETDEVLSLIHI